MKQELKVVALALAMALILLCGVAVGTVNGGITITINGGTGAVSTGGSSTGGSGTTQAPQQTLGDQAGASTEPQDKVQTSTGLERPADTDYAGICEAYNKAVNDYRAYKGVVTTTKVETVDIKAKDIPKAVEGVVNGVVQKFLGTTENTWTFENGADQADPTRLIGHKMIPYDRDAKVTPNDLVAAKIVETSDGGYTITITFKAETATFDGSSSTEPASHMTAMDPLNLATLDISPLTINSATMNYPGATVELTVDGQGRLVKLHNNLPLNGNGAGGYKFIELSLGLEGSMDSTYTMVYA